MRISICMLFQHYCYPKLVFLGFTMWLIFVIFLSHGTSLSAVSIYIFDFFPRNMLKSVRKNDGHEIFELLKNCLGSISPKISQETENDTVGHYRFG